MIKSIGILGGTGQMGRMFAKAFREIGCDVIALGRCSATDEKHLVRESELVIITVPIHETVSVIRRVRGLLNKHQLFSDFTSVKSHVIPEMLETEASLISCHPMFGGMNEMSGQNAILLPVNPGKYLKKYQRLLQDLHLNVVMMADWKKHDETMSIIQGLMHFIHIVFSRTLQSRDIDLQTILSICSPVYQANFAFACRILQRDPKLYTNILMDNPENESILKSFLDEAKQSFKEITKKDEETFSERFESCRDFLGDFGKDFSKQSNFLVESLQKLST